MVRVISTEALPRRSRSPRSSRGAEPWTKRKISGTWHTPTSFKTSSSCTTPSSSLLVHGWPWHHANMGKKHPISSRLGVTCAKLCLKLQRCKQFTNCRWCYCELQIYNLKKLVFNITANDYIYIESELPARILQIFADPNESTRQRFKRHCRKQEQTELFGLGLHPKNHPDSCKNASVAGMVSESQNRYTYSARWV